VQSLSISPKIRSRIYSCSAVLDLHDGIQCLYDLDFYGHIVCMNKYQSWNAGHDAEVNSVEVFLYFGHISESSLQTETSLRSAQLKIAICFLFVCIC